MLSATPTTASLQHGPAPLQGSAEQRRRMRQQDRLARKRSTRAA